MGVYSPQDGQRRVDAELKAKDEHIEAQEIHIAALKAANARLQAMVKFLGGEKQKVDEDNRTLRSDLEMADGVAEMRKVKTDVDKGAATMPLRVVTHWGTTDPGVMNDHLHRRSGNAPDQASQVS